MNRKILILSLTSVLLLTCTISTFAQGKKKEFEDFSDRIFYGGTIGLLFGTETRIDVLPQVGIWVLPQWSLGVGGRYSFLKTSYNIAGIETRPIKTHIWGISGFTQIMPIRDLDRAFGIGIHGGPIFQAEWEGLYLDKSLGRADVSTSDGKGWLHLVLVGAGYRFPLGDKAALNLLAMWNLTDSRYSPYSSNPMLRVSINF